jgi:selenium metabolism protein YedF
MDKNDALIIDCRGLVCPQPVINTRDAIAGRPAALTVLVDYPPSKENVTRFLQKSGYSAEPEARGDGVWAIHGTCEMCAEAEKIISDACPAAPLARAGEKRTLIFLATDVIGHGSDELGGKLMGNFLATLTEMPSLWRIVMVNGGVRLASTPGKCLDALKKLEAQGVSILVCGTCLDYYHLMDKKEVGETTNMLDIVTSLDLADNVIRP